MNELKKELFEVLKANGAELVGVADIEGILDTDMKRGISVVMHIPVEIVEQLRDHPTDETQTAYAAFRPCIEVAVNAGVDFLKEKGYNVITGMLNDKPIPNKTVATRAGIGWVGKNNIVVTKEFGSAIRLASILTDAPLEADQPITESQCGACDLCVRNCPAKALTGKLWEPGLEYGELHSVDACRGYAQERKAKDPYYANIGMCGKCYAVCTYTQAYHNRLKKGNA